jgi:hypothetical protein
VANHKNVVSTLPSPRFDSGPQCHQSEACEGEIATDVDQENGELINARKELEEVRARLNKEGSPAMAMEMECTSF